MMDGMVSRTLGVMHSEVAIQWHLVQVYSEVAGAQPAGFEAFDAVVLLSLLTVATYAE